MLRNIVTESLYRLAALSEKFDVYHPWQELLASQWLDTSELEKLQESRLRNILRFATAEVPFYKSKAVGISPDLLTENPREFLNRLEVTTRTALTSVPENTRTALNPKLKTGVSIRTSGTESARLVLKIDNAAFLQKYALLLRSFYSLGWRPGDSVYSLWPLSHEAYHPGASDLRRHIADMILQPKKYLTPMPSEGLSEERAMLMAKKIAAGNPVIIEGDGHYVGRIAEAMQRYDIKPPSSLRGIRLATCPSPEAGRRRIAEVFNCSVFDDYGPHEMEGVSRQCSNGGPMHFSAESYFMEVVDDSGRPCKHGEVGNLCLTDLDNRVQPLIRYLIGDVVKAGYIEGKCKCGRGLPMVHHTEGRRSECLETSKGLFTSLAFLDIMAQFKLENRSRMIRTAENVIRLEVSPYRRDIETEEEAAHALTSALGGEYKVEVTFVPVMPLTKSGKVRYLTDETQS